MQTGDYLRHKFTGDVFKITSVKYEVCTEDINGSEYTIRAFNFFNLIPKDKDFVEIREYKHPKDGQWCFSDDNEEFSDDTVYDTKEEAVQAAKDSGDYEHGIWVGLLKTYKPRIWVDELLEDIREQAYENTYEDISEGFLTDCSEQSQKELEETLNSVFIKWLYNNGYEPKFYDIVKIEYVEFESAD